MPNNLLRNLLKNLLKATLLLAVFPALLAASVVSKIEANAFYLDECEQLADKESFYVTRDILGTKSITQRALLLDKSLCQAALVKDLELARDNFANLNVKLKLGDIAVPNPASSTLIIAPNKASYEAASQGLEVIASELFLGFLIDRASKAYPLQLDFVDFCSSFNVKNLIIVLENERRHYDCAAFYLQRREALPAQGESVKSGFYTVLGNTDTGNKPYYAYYKKLLSQKTYKRSKSFGQNIWDQVFKDEEELEEKTLFLPSSYSNK